MNNFTKNLVAVLTLTLPFQASAVDLLKANDFFKDKEYQQALTLYQQGAKVGSAHAYYQLGMMHLKGLSVEKDLTNSFLYFALAAEQNYAQAQDILDSMLVGLEQQQLNIIQTSLEQFKQEQKAYTSKYLPEIIEENLAYKVTFGGQPALEKKFFVDVPEMDTGIGYGYSYSEWGSSGGVIISKPSFLIVEHDVATDGSVRNISKIQKAGLTSRYMNDYKLFPLAQPQFKGQAVEFPTRVFMGAAATDNFELADQLPRLYGSIRAIVRKAENSNSLHDQHQYAMAMVNFPWLEEQPNQAKTLLKSLAQQGHPASMYEYGFKLYTEQKDIPEAVKWITEASKYGLARAEYRLAKLLTSSPWVKKDEKKALFWFESAMEKGHAAATLHAAKIKLTADDETLRDVEGAIEYLAMAQQSQTLNPEFFHLLAISYKDRPARDFKLVVENLERAIFMGSRANWDVSEWQALLAEFTTGNVTISAS
ncbi:tetratricopeptide repeat protein [Catenovulum agarivorans]|uniref:tetratricopeptide repeat protein n=1 Tax=Catenovulum agarivorans TaxID=1172192 RepID=UPI0003114F4A|nr:SEL1-like repeat protein [Catenovulum agarivorans]